MVVDENTDIVTGQCFANLLIIIFASLSECGIVNIKDKSAHFISFLYQLRLIFHPFRVDFRSTENDVETKGGQLVTVSVSQLVNTVKDHCPSWLAVTGGDVLRGQTFWREED